MGNLGTAGFTTGEADYTTMAIDSSTGTPIPYVVFQDGANSYKASVMKYTYPSN